MNGVVKGVIVGAIVAAAAWGASRGEANPQVACSTSATSCGTGPVQLAPASFPLEAPIDQACATPSYGFVGAPGIGITNDGSQLVSCSAGVARARLDGTGLQLGAIPINFSSSATSAPGDVGFQRAAANIVRVTNGSSGLGWLQQGAGHVALDNSLYTNATTVFSNTNLAITVKSGQIYTFAANLFVTESTAADGAKLDFAGGTAAATAFVASCVLTNAVGTVLAQVNATSAALATSINIAAFTNTSVHTYRCVGSLTPSSNGTFILRAAQNAHTTGTLTMIRGSSIWIEDTIPG